MRTYCLVTFLLVSPTLHAQDMPLSDILIPGEGWKKVDGTFTPISRLSLSGEKSHPHAMIVWNANNHPQALLDSNGATLKADLPEATKYSSLWVFGERRTYILSQKDLLGIGPAPLVSPGRNMKLPLKEASVLVVSPDRGSLLIGDAADRYIWVYRIDSEELPSAGEKYMTMRVLPYVASTLKQKPKTEPRSDISAIDFDSAGRTYAATNIGVQVFDPTGRLCGVLTNPSKERLTAMCFGGAKGDRLFIACGKEIYSRPLKATRAPLKEKDKK